MPQPIINLITNNVESTLMGVNTNANYSNTLIVSRDMKDFEANRIRDRLCILTRDDPVIEEDGPINHHQVLVTFHATLCAELPQDNEQTLDEKLGLLYADVVSAILEDHTRGTLAVDTMLGTANPVDLGAGGVGGMQIDFQVRYRTLYGNPFQQ
jgi:hypothetical protein